MEKMREMGRGLGCEPAEQALTVAWLRCAGRRLGAVLTLALLTACSSLPPPPEASAPPTAERREVRLGLALGGGAARGFAHVGVIQVLEEAGLRPSHVAGTSAGSLVAALYASGKSPTELVRVAQTMQEAADRKFNRTSLNIAPPGGHHATEPGRFEPSMRARKPRLSDMPPFSALPAAALPRSVGQTAVAFPHQLTR